MFGGPSGRDHRLLCSDRALVNSCLAPLLSSPRLRCRPPLAAQLVFHSRCSLHRTSCSVARTLPWARRRRKVLASRLRSTLLNATRCTLPLCRKRLPELTARPLQQLQACTCHASNPQILPRPRLSSQCVLCSGSTARVEVHPADGSRCLSPLPDEESRASSTSSNAKTPQPEAEAWDGEISGASFYARVR